MRIKSSRFQLVVPAQVLAEVKALADQENRSISNMIVSLLIEALKGRKGTQKESVSSGNRKPVLSEQAA